MQIIGVSCGVFTKVQVQRMTNGLLRSSNGLFIPVNAVGRSHCQNNFGNAVPMGTLFPGVPAGTEPCIQCNCKWVYTNSLLFVLSFYIEFAKWFWKNCDSSSYNEEKLQHHLGPSHSHEPPSTFGILGCPVLTCLDLPPAFYTTWLRQDQIYILCIVKWIKDFPHQSHGNLFEFCSADCAYHRMRYEGGLNKTL